MIITVFVGLLANASSAIAEEILKEVSVKQKADLIEITAKMSTKFKYIKHFPTRRGKIIQIQIAAADETADKKFFKRRDTIKSPENEFLAIRDVIYEGNVRGGPYLVLRFPDVVDFSIKPMAVSDEITILVKSEKPQAAVQAQQPVDSDNGKTDGSLDQLMRDARVALTNGKNSEAILQFTEILKQDNPKYNADAKEYLGLARERNGQLELAKQEYEDYLKLYPKHPRASTVNQRLMTLNARLAMPKRELKEAKRQAELAGDKFKQVDVFGRVSSIYYDAHIAQDGSPFTAQQNLWMNFFDITRRQRDQDKEIRYVFSGSHEIDWLEDRRMEARVRSAYFDYKNKVNGLEFAFGRQSVNTGGVLGRFDGGIFGFSIKPKIKGYLVGGFPVDFIEHREIQQNKPMAGGRIDFSKIKQNWNGSLYAITQRVDDIWNRRAVGAEARYFQDKKIFYSLVDYDVGFGEWNFITFHYGWEFNEKTKMDVHFDKRKSPVVLSSNALLGLTSVTDTKKVGANISSLDELKASRSVKDLIEAGMTAEEIMQRAKEVTGNSTLITSSVRRIITQDLDFNATLTLSKYNPGQALEEDDDLPKDTSFLPSPDEFDIAFNAQLIQRNLFKERDILLGGFRITDNDTSRRYEINSNLRYPINPNLWISPKLRLMYTKNSAQKKSSTRISPKFQSEYKINKKLSVDGEIGLDYNNSDQKGENYKWFSGNVGFRYLF